MVWYFGHCMTINSQVLPKKGNSGGSWITACYQGGPFPVAMMAHEMLIPLGDGKWPSSSLWTKHRPELFSLVRHCFLSLELQHLLENPSSGFHKDLLSYGGQENKPQFLTYKMQATNTTTICSDVLMKQLHVSTVPETKSGYVWKSML